jgi:hypothetical protein
MLRKNEEPEAQSLCREIACEMELRKEGGYEEIVESLGL